MADAPARPAPRSLDWPALKARLNVWFRPRRRLKSTRAGQAVIAITLAVGFAAFNTGNNLLFFGWGLLLSSIVVSGILSEATLQAVSLEPRAPGEVRARSPGVLPFVVANRRRLPAFAVQIEALVDTQGKAGHGVAAARTFELRIDPGANKTVDLRFVPQRRGVLRVAAARAVTAFPFGFFEKEKRVFLDVPMEIVVLPGRVDVQRAARDLLSRLGESPAHRAGPGDELFSLRPFRAGDDPRRIAWRRAARTNRLVVRETEAARSNDVLLELVVGADTSADDLDHAIDVCASLAEDLLGAGQAVGLRAPGAGLVPANGPRQRSALLTRLALLDATALVEPVSVRRAAVVAIVARGGTAPRDAGAVLHADQVSPRSTPA